LNWRKRGVIVTKKQEDKLAEYRDKIIQVNGNKTLFATFQKKMMSSNPALATTLKKEFQ
jgi:gamma-glutamyltranspeptidase/glutathione hydrolase